MQTTRILLFLLLLAAPAAVPAQDAYSTNADGSIYTYSTNADGSANIVAYAGPPWVVTIPTNINGLTVTSIGLGAFEADTITRVTIPNSVTSIGNWAFYYCLGLTSVTVPNSVTSIGDEAFLDCYTLTGVTIPNSVTSIGAFTFFNCFNLTSVTIGNSATNIGEGAFKLCSSLTSVTIPNSVTSIGSFAFGSCTDLTGVTIGPNVSSIGDYAFEECVRLTGVYFQGNSPSPTNDSTVFSGDPNGDPATVYYLPGTTGWGATFDGRPTAPWFLANAQILTNGDILIQFSGRVPGALYDVEESRDLLTWTVTATDQANAMGSFSFEDTATAGVPMRYYRAARAFTVGGTLTWLPAGDTVTLQDNGSDSLTLSTNGTFTFPTALPNGHAYSVTVSGTSGDTPAICTLTNGSGTISGANVTNVQCMSTQTGCPALTGNRDLDMYNAAVSDGTANGGVPGVMLTENGGPFRVTAVGICSEDVCLTYYPWCWFDITVGANSCSSTTFPSGTPVIAFGTSLECGFFPYGY